MRTAIKSTTTPATVCHEPRVPARLADVACLQDAAEAQKACNGGKVESTAARPSRIGRGHVGDELRLTRLQGRRQVVVVRALADGTRRRPKRGRSTKT